MDSGKPVHQRQFGAVHDSSATQGGVMPTFSTYPAFIVFVPSVMRIAIMTANHTCFLTLLLQM